MLTETREGVTMSVTRSNEPPDLWSALDPTYMASFLVERFRRHITKRDEPLAGFARFQKATANGITSDEIAGKATDFKNQLRAAVTDTEETRTTVKNPILLAGRQIDAIGKEITDPVNNARIEVERRITEYLDHKDREARRIAEEEAQRKAAEAQALMEAAAQANDDAMMEDAEELGEQSIAAKDIADAPPAELTRIRTQLGSTVALRDYWVYKGISDLGLVPREFLMVNEKMVRAAIQTGTRSIPGLIIANERKAR